MKMMRSLLLIPLLLVGSVHAFSTVRTTRGLATEIRREGSFRVIPTATQSHGPKGVNVPLQLFATTREDDISSPRKQGKLRWIRNLFARRPRVPVKAKRLFSAFFVAMALFMSGMSPGPAHAASPFAVKFTGMEVVARGPEWSSAGGSLDASSDMLSLAMQKRQATLSRQQALAAVTGRSSTAMIMAASMAAAVAVPTGVSVALFRKADSNEKVVDELMLKQKELIDQVSTLSQAVASNEEEAGGPYGSLGSELLFLALSGLSAYATYFVSNPPE
ncbi:expressed unknown protein [Seminavis robusta]|uniref:Transmembrane protein n=1 Tax=Seminavis robusta TaxID=568900 RepID=A0A9N8DSV8_9STRA|nr:expressed unknown protein [Seminavis robusta]|eukprot:Sro347_g122850.1 n/a (275) ;mRNA; r:12620-13444